MTETKDYPLPTVHLNGTSKEMLYKGNIHILQAINELEESISKCEFHGRDYYVQDTGRWESCDKDPHSYGTYNTALKERQKHFKNILAFKDYIETHLTHIDNQ